MTKKKQRGKRSKQKPPSIKKYIQDTTHLEALKAALNMQRMGMLIEAKNAFEQILKLDPNYYEANSALGLLLHQQNQNEMALVYLERAAQIRPKEFDALWNLGVVQQKSALAADAEQTFTTLLSLAPTDTRTLITLACIHLDRNKPDEASPLIDRAIKIEPKNAMAYSQRGLIEKAKGNIEASLKSYRKAIALNPTMGEAYRGLADLYKYKEHNDDVALMEKAYQTENLPEIERMLIGYSLSKVYDDIGKYEESFRALEQANNVNRSTYQYSIALQMQRFDDHKNQLGKEFQERLAEKGYEDRTPIFIVGMPRSGTSLTEQILASHSTVHGAGEVDYLRLVTDASDAQTGMPFPLGLNTVHEQHLINGAIKYVEQLRRGVESSITHVTDKLPHNFLRVGLINAVLPNAKIIHCTRNPIDNCLSIYQQYFTPAHGYGQSLEELGQYYIMYQKLMNFWYELLPNKIYTMSYEEMIEQPEKQVRSLLAHCDLEYEESCLNFHTTKRTVNTPSATQVRKPIYKSAVMKWKRYEQQLQPLVDILEKG